MALAAGALTFRRRNSNCQESGRSGGGVSLDEPPHAAKSQQTELTTNRADCVRTRMQQSVARLGKSGDLGPTSGRLFGRALAQC